MKSKHIEKKKKSTGIFVNMIELEWEKNQTAMTPIYNTMKELTRGEKSVWVIMYIFPAGIRSWGQQK